MIKRILYIGAILLALFMLWVAFKALVSNNDTTSRNFFQTDFLSAISEQVVGPLDGSANERDPFVNTEELGEFSPLMGLVNITSASTHAASQDVASEYIEIQAAESNAAPINISDWSIQSLVTGTWYGIPKGTETYISGEVNTVDDIFLNPGEKAIIATRPSPVGVSFRANACSGFLNTTQPFTPTLRTSCVEPEDILPPTIQNIQTYGDACIAFVENFPRCSYLTAADRDYDALSDTCRAHIQPRLTYNFCVGNKQNDADFHKPNHWRIFLESTEPLWKERLEVIRILDERNRTVDVLSY